MGNSFLELPIDILFTAVYNGYGFNRKNDFVGRKIMEEISKVNTIKTMYLIGIQQKTIRTHFRFQFEALKNSRIFDDREIDILRSACALRSIMFSFANYYLNKNGQGVSIYDALPSSCTHFIEDLDEFYLDEEWDDDGVVAVVNKLSSIINERDYLLGRVGIEDSGKVFKVLFYMPKLSGDDFVRQAELYQECRKELDIEIFVPHIESYGEKIKNLYVNDQCLYTIIDDVKDKIIDFGMRIFDVRKDWAGNKIIHYIDMENQHPFHVMQVCNAAPDKHGIKLFYEANIGVTDKCGDRVEKYKVKRVVPGKSQVDQALMSHIMRDQPDVAVIHSGDSDYYQTISVFNDKIKFVVVTRADSISSSYLDQLKKIGVEVYYYNDSDFSSVEIYPLVSAETACILRKTPFDKWNANDIAEQVANTLLLRKDRVSPLVAKKVDEVSKAFSNALKAINKVG